MLQVAVRSPNVTTIEIERLGSAVVLRITGRPSLGPPWEDGLRHKFDLLIDRGERAFIVDITHYEGRDDDVVLIGEIVAVFREVKKRNGTFSVVASPSQRECFRILALDSVIRIVDNESQALSKSAADDADRETSEDAG